MEELPSVDVSNVLSEETKKRSLRQIQKALGVRRETAGEYLKAAGVPVRPPGSWGKKPPAKPAKEVATDSPEPKPANGVTADLAVDVTAERPKPPTPPASQSPTAASVSEPYRELIENGLARGRNAMSIFQEMVDQHASLAPTKASSASSANCAAHLSRRARSSLRSWDKRRKWTTALVRRFEIPTAASTGARVYS